MNRSVIALLLLVVLVAGCIQGNVLGPKKEEVVVKSIKSGDTVKVEYTGKLTDGTTFDSSVGRDPLEFVVGTSQLIAGFDEAVIGMKVGEQKTITIPPEKAYGAIDPSMVQEVPLSTLTDAGIAPTAGMQLSAGGRPVLVERVDGNAVFVNFNHPLAGKTLVFSIKIIDINSA